MPDFGVGPNEEERLDGPPFLDGPRGFDGVGQFVNNFYSKGSITLEYSSISMYLKSGQLKEHDSRKINFDNDLSL